MKIFPLQTPAAHDDGGMPTVSRVELRQPNRRHRLKHRLAVKECLAMLRPRAQRPADLTAQRRPGPLVAQRHAHPDPHHGHVVEHLYMKDKCI